MSSLPSWFMSSHSRRCHHGWNSSLMCLPVDTLIPPTQSLFQIAAREILLKVKPAYLTFLKTLQWLPNPPQGKSKVFITTTRSYSAWLLVTSRLHRLVPLSPLFLLQNHSLFDLEHAKHKTASGPLHVRSPLAGTTGPQKFSRLILYFPQISARVSPHQNLHCPLLLYTAMFFRAFATSWYRFIFLLLIACLIPHNNAANSLKTRTVSCPLLHSCFLEQGLPQGRYSYL